MMTAAPPVGDLETGLTLAVGLLLLGLIAYWGIRVLDKVLNGVDDGG